MHVFLVVILLFSISGCVSVEIDSSLNKKSESSKALSAIAGVRPGMSKEEVKGIMGEQLIIGYKVSESTQGAFEPIYAGSPYKSESISVKDQQFLIDYYFTKVYKPDGLVSEEELTPVIYKDGAVIGKGWNAKYELEKQ